jgi:hypothetical protein
MALEFKKLSEVTVAEEVSDAANLLVEDNGEIKRISKKGIGGGSAGGIVVFTYLGDEEWSCSHTFTEFAEMYDNLTLNIVQIRVLSEDRYFFDRVTEIVPYNSSSVVVSIGDTVNNAEYFMINEFLQFFRDGFISASVPE